jgi:hypothetical protein
MVINTKRVVHFFLAFLSCALVGCHKAIATAPPGLSQIHGEKWPELRGDTFHASVRIVPVHRDGYLVFELMMSHGLLLDNPLAHFAPEEIRARILVGDRQLLASGVRVPGNVMESTEVEIFFDTGWMNTGPAPAELELLIEVRGAMLLECWSLRP